MMRAGLCFGMGIANAGDPEAQNDLGIMYYEGNVPRDYKKAAEWYRKATKRRNG
jgi:TPR repeat protein